MTENLTVPPPMQRELSGGPRWSSDVFGPPSPSSPKFNELPLSVSTLPKDNHTLREHQLVTPINSPPSLSPSVGERYYCKQCNKAFSKRFKLSSHERTVHIDEIDKVFNCQTCTKRFVRLHDLQRHVKTHTHEKSNICQYCDRGFSRLDALRRHMQPGSYKPCAGSSVSSRRKLM
jgi:uncharacterized Zn-finger protein